MDNFPIAEEFLLKSASVEVHNAGDIERTVIELLTDEEKAERMGANAKELLEKNAGAVKKAVDLIRGYLGTV
jgi:3-deoxy-D-manno-octulosonic-acid transferase